MAAPSPSARSDPAGLKLKDGYSTLITFGRDTDIELWEKTVKPPGMDGGDGIDQTTMHNDDWRTMAPRSLVTLTECTFVAAYDPVCYTSLLNILNVEDTITVTFGDGSTVAFYGFMSKFEPSEVSEGAQPEATVTIMPTNWDPANDVEAGPAVSSVSGT